MANTCLFIYWAGHRDSYIAGSRMYTDWIGNGYFNHFFIFKEEIMASCKINWKKALKLLAAIGFCQAAGAVGSMFTAPAITTWYAALNKPAFSPPNWVFAPVWLTLYTLMGISLYLVWESKSQKKKIAIAVFGIQLFLNALWSIVFFGMRNILGGLINILAMWALILGTMVLFYKISKPAAYVLIPYIVWVSIATALNYSLFVLN